MEGLIYIEDFITPELEQSLITMVDDHEWLSPFARRVQHYGYVYDYKARTVTSESYIGNLPDWLDNLALKLNIQDLTPFIPDQVIINEYLPGQGIGMHIDCEPCFDTTIASLTLGGGCMMNFRNKDDREMTSNQWLAPRSLLVLSDKARYGWLHGIPARKHDLIGEMAIPRTRRISLTFRKVILGG